MAQPRTARLGLGFIWGVLGFSLIGIIVILFRQAGAPVDEYEQQRAENRLKTRLELEEAAQKKLSEYAWVNKENGVVGIPIDRAVELTVAQLQTQKVGDSGEKAVIMPTLLVPGYLKEQGEQGEAPAAETPATEGEEAQSSEAGEAKEGEEAAPEAAPEGEAQPAEAGGAQPSPEAAPESAAPESGEATPTPSPASPEAAPEAGTESAAPTATEAAPAASETPSEP